jgi:hypothetical protein
MQTALVEARKQALNGTAENIFELPSVPDRNTLVSWTGAYDEGASQYVPLDESCQSLAAGWHILSGAPCPPLFCAVADFEAA